MKYEIADCIDAGTEYCPCHLAEAGECIICSQLHGKDFCDCLNWKGVCIYKEYYDNGNKPRDQRLTFNCKILNKEVSDDKMILFTILVPHKLAKDLTHPGSYVFLRTPSTMQFYDTPISVMETNLEENTIKVAIEIRGIKTKTIENLKEDNMILLRGPFWNGILGLKNIYSVKDGVSLIIAKGIAMAPTVPVLKYLYGNGNKLIVILDKSPYTSIFIKKYLELYDCEIIECSTISKGTLSSEFKAALSKVLQDHSINLIHCDGPDILHLKMVELIKEQYKMSCSNNTKMCCGEGVCGACSTRYEGRRVKRLCKFQSDPINVFEGRRFI